MKRSNLKGDVLFIAIFFLQDWKKPGFKKQPSEFFGFLNISLEKRIFRDFFSSSTHWGASSLSIKITFAI
jgi:hypothetical protein